MCYSNLLHCSSFKFKTSWLFYVPNKQIPYVVGNFYGKFSIDYFKRTKENSNITREGDETGERRRGLPSPFPPPRSFPVFFLALGPGRSRIPRPSDPTWLTEGAHY